MIPRMIHQIWEEVTETLPKEFSKYAETWKEYHPTWQYEFWNQNRMETFVRSYYPGFADKYFSYPYDAQRWNVIRYLILYKMGGVYVDFDYECLEPVDNYIKEKTCCLGEEPDEHAKMFQKPVLVSNSFIASIQKHPFLKQIIKELYQAVSPATDKVNCVLETTGSLFLSDIYRSYSKKEEITLFPNKILSPWSHRDVQMFFRHGISEDIMEEKLRDAIAIHYFRRSWQIDATAKKADILYVSMSNGGSGAPRAAYRIHTGLRQLGIDSVMLVKSLVEKDPNVYAAEQPPDLAEADRLPLQNYQRTKSHILFSPATAGINFRQYVNLFNPEIIQLHWIDGGFIRIEDLSEIKRKIVWRFADCWPMTGGCHYPGDCTGFRKSCGRCPQLNSDKSGDLSHETWQRKFHAWKNTDITVVVPTQWMKDMAEKSSLFGKSRIELIPNGLDLTLFYPLDKPAARKILNINPGKKVILYGAYKAVQNPRKGFYLLVEALEKIFLNHSSEYEVIVFGSNGNDIKTNFPVRFLGFLHDHSLQIAYSAADVMIVPSLEEAFGQTVSEAMACGTPVVAFTHTGPAGIVDHLKNGYLAQHGNAEDLAKGIEWILEDSYRNRDLLENARKKAVGFYDIGTVAKQYAQLYNSLK